MIVITKRKTIRNTLAVTFCVASSLVGRTQQPLTPDSTVVVVPATTSAPHSVAQPVAVIYKVPLSSSNSAPVALEPAVASHTEAPAGVSTSQPLPDVKTTSTLPAPSQKGTRIEPTRVDMRPFHRYAIGLKLSSVGAGVEVATPLSRSTNIRGTVNYFQYNESLTEDGATYTGRLQMRGGEFALDWFPFHGAFHISPGIFVHSNNVGATMNVPGGGAFSLGDQDFVSDPSNPIHGLGSLRYSRKIAPMLLMGFGNILPRSGRHFSVPFEFGGAYLGAPQLALQFNGGACVSALDPDGDPVSGCDDIHNDPDFQPQLDAEQKKLQNDLNAVKFFPIVSTGIAFSF